MTNWLMELGVYLMSAVLQVVGGVVGIYILVLVAVEITDRFASERVAMVFTAALFGELFLLGTIAYGVGWLL